MERLRGFDCRLHLRQIVAPAAATLLLAVLMACGGSQGDSLTASDDNNVAGNPDSGSEASLYSADYERQLVAVTPSYPPERIPTPYLALPEQNAANGNGQKLGIVPTIPTSSGRWASRRILLWKLGQKAPPALIPGASASSTPASASANTGATTLRPTASAMARSWSASGWWTGNICTVPAGQDARRFALGPQPHAGAGLVPD